MEITPPFYRVSIKAYIENKDGKFLLTQERDGNWEIPGGGWDSEETPHECLKRELFEEMGLKTTWIDDRPLYITHVIHSTGKHMLVNIIYRARVSNFDFTPSNECLEIGFFDWSEAQSLKQALSSVKALLHVMKNAPSL
jgi:8-oxo-dGTP pyrophosphatase MutT (NUDIX family)